MARLGGNTRHTPGPGDLTRHGDPQWVTPGPCPECEGDHPVSRCPAVAAMFAATPKKETPPVAIKRDLSDLPPAGGHTPDPTPRFVGVLVDEWAAERDGDKATALGTPFRHSDAGKCARAISYTAAGIPRSDPMDLPGVWNTSLGSLIHEHWQEALLRRWPDAEVEVTCATVGADGSGHIDAVIRTECPDCERCTDGWRTIAVELKTIGGFGFKGAVGAARKGTPAEGPKAAHLLQAAINGRAVDADEVVVAYLAKECISATVAQRFGITDDVGRFAAEWTLTREQYEPLADAEAERVAGVLALVADGRLAARKSPEMPPGAEVTDPTTGAWASHLTTDDGERVVADTGSTWECAPYCGFHTLCAQTTAGRIPVADAIEVAVSLGLTERKAVA